MCRLLAYLGPPVSLARLLVEPEHSLLEQSYAPREMTSGRVNADGFGIAWYDSRRQEAPFLYRNILPIWADVNLDSLARYVESGCVLANVRSATPGQSLDFVNTHPFLCGSVSAMHNGFVTEFRRTLQRPLRERLSDETYAAVRGDTDSELLSAWIFHHLDGAEGLAQALTRALAGLAEMAPDAVMTLNFILSDGRGLVASRLAQGARAPSLYYASGTLPFPGAVLIASEPLFDDEGWRSCPDSSVLTVEHNGDIRIEPFGG